MSTKHKGRGFLGRWRRRGAAAIEFVLITPTLVLLFAGIVEYGRIYQQLGFLHVIAADAARTGSMVPLDEDPDLKAIAKAHELLWGYDIRCIYCVDSSISLGTYDTIAVELRRPYVPILGLVPTPLWLQSRTTMMMWEQVD
jgi:hypothetical protein